MRKFNGSTNNYLSFGSVGVSAMPLSFLAWVFPFTDLSTEQTIVGVSNALSANGTGWWMEIFSGGIIAISGNLENYFLASQSGLIANRWNLCGAVFASSTSRTAYVNGVAGTANTTSSTPASVDTTSIGVFNARSGGNPLLANPLTAIVAEVAVFNVEVSALEMARAYQAKGPWNVGRDVSRNWWATAGLPIPVGYYSLARHSAPEYDLIGTVNLSQTGSVPNADQVLPFPRFRTQRRSLYRVAAASTFRSRLTLMGAG